MLDGWNVPVFVGRLKSPASMMALLQLFAKRDSDRCSWSNTSAPVFGGGAVESSDGETFLVL